MMKVLGVMSCSTYRSYFAVLLNLILSLFTLSATGSAVASPRRAAHILYIESSDAEATPAKRDFMFKIGGGFKISQVQIINGVPVEPLAKQEEWPAIAVALLGDGINQERCTGTLVGPGLMLLAAHCLDVPGQVELRAAFVELGDKRRRMHCAIPASYRLLPSQQAPLPRNSADFALCYDASLIVSDGSDKLIFETLDVAQVKVRTPVLLMGFGCTNIVNTDLGDMAFRVGDSSIDRAASGRDALAGYAEVRTTSQGKAAICEGDSGGPVMTGVSIQAQTLSRRVRGVNSALQLEQWGLLPQLAMLSHPDFVPFARQWLSRYPSTYACGLTHAAVRPCRP